MNDDEMKAAKVRACRHMTRQVDELGNWRCFNCGAFLRPAVAPDSIVGRISQQIWQAYVARTGVSLPAGLADEMAQAAVTALGITEEHRTLTNGWIQPMYGAMERLQGIELPPPDIREQGRWVTPWEDAT